MKKILFIINSLKCGGAERLLLDIVKKLPAEKYDVSVLVFNKKVMFDDELKDVNIINALNVGNRVSHYFRRLLSFFGLLDSFYKYNIRKTVDHYDTIISFLEGFPLRAHSYLLDRASKHITFVHTDLSTYKDSIRQFTDAESMVRVYNSMDSIIFVSDGALKGFNASISNVRSPKTVLENCIDIELIKHKAEQFQVPTDTFSIVTVGRVTEVKGFGIIPEIAKLFKYKGINVHFTIVGDGGYMPELRKLINEMNVGNLITLTGFQSNPYPYIKSSDIYISTSITEGLPLSLCEAMALGKPIIASPTVGAKELLSDGTGIIVNRTPEEYFNTISRLMESPELILEYSRLSSRKAAYYDSSEYMSRFIELI